MPRTRPARKRPSQQTGRLPASTVKAADAKGRVALGGHFANRHVIVETISEYEVVVRLSRVIPESEAWLYENAEALQAVRTGLSQARERQVAEGPDLEGDTRLAARLED